MYFGSHQGTLSFSQRFSLPMKAKICHWLLLIRHVSLKVKNKNQGAHELKNSFYGPHLLLHKKTVKIFKSKIGKPTYFQKASRQIPPHDISSLIETKFYQIADASKYEP